MSQLDLFDDGLGPEPRPHYTAPVLNPRSTAERRRCRWCGKATRHLWSPVGEVWLCNAAGCGLGQ